MKPVRLLVLALTILLAVAPVTPSGAQTPVPPTSTPTATPTPPPTVVGLTVTSVTPATASAISPTPITVAGTGFTVGSTVMIGSRSLPAQFVDATTLRATVPIGMPLGPHPVSVVTPSGTSAPLTGGFSVFGLGSVLYVPVAVRNASGDDSGVQVQNTSGASSTVYIIYYDQSGNVVTADGPQIVQGGGSWTFYQPSDTGLPTGFDGSAVVHATQTSAAIVNRVNYTRTTQASTSSITVPAATANQITIPLVYGGQNGFVSTLSIQNTSPSLATYTLNLQPNGFASPAVTVQVPIAPLAVRRIRVGTDVAVPASFIGTATINSPSNSLTAVAETINASTSVFIGSAGFATGATTINAPLLFKNYNGWVSGAQVANLSASTITVNATLRNRDNDIAFGLPPVTLGPNQGYFYDLAALPSIPDEFVGAGVFTSTGPSAVTVQEINATRSTGMGYNGFASGTTSISIPLVFKDSNGWDTGVQVQNLGGIETVLTITYALPSGFTVSESATVGAGDSVTFYQPTNTALPTSLVGSATVTSTGQPIVAIVNEVNYIRGGDAAMAYEGINY